MTMHNHGDSSLYRRFRHARDDDGYATVAAAEGLSRGDLPCPVAQRIAGLNHASVVSCRTDNRDVLLEVTAGVSVTSAHAKARAGPV